jgi:hypothetical protein
MPGGGVMWEGSTAGSADCGLGVRQAQTQVLLYQPRRCGCQTQVLLYQPRRCGCQTQVLLHLVE